MAKKKPHPLYHDVEDLFTQLTPLLADVSNALNFAANLDSLDDTRTDVTARVDFDSAADALLSDAREKAKRSLELVEQIETAIAKGGSHG